MTPEISWLSASAAVFFLYFLGEVVTGNMQYKPKELLGPRDSLPPHGPAVARAKRATMNMVEAMCLFVPVMLAAILSDRTNDMTALGGAIFVISRIIYAPTYWFGVPVLRSLVYACGLTGTGLIFLQVIPFSGAN
jgi:uncharacterized MAPEG superfamily protein